MVFAALLDLSERKLRWEKEVADSFIIVGFPRLDPAGTLLAVRVAESQDLDCSIRVFDSTTGNENLRIPLPAKSRPGEATFSPDGRSLVGLVQDGSLNEPGNPTSISNRFWVWDVETGQARLSSPVANGSSNLLFSHDGTMALVGDYRSRRPELIHLETGIVIARFDKDESQVSRFSSDDRFIETISHDGKLSRFEIPRNPFRNGKLEHYDGLGPSCISGDGTRFARLARPQRNIEITSGSDNGAQRLLVYDSVGALEHAISVSDEKINRSDSETVRKFVVLDEHGTHTTMVVGGKDDSRRIVTLDLNHPDQAAMPLYVLGDDVSLHTLISSPTGSSVAAILDDDGSHVTKPFVQPTFRIWTSKSPKRRFIQVWDAGTQREIKLPKFVHPHAAGFSADGQLLAVASLTSDGASTIVSLVRLRSGEILETFDIGQDYVSQMEFAPSDKLLACVTPSSESIHLYHRVSKSLSKFATQTVNDKTTITFSEDSSRLAAITPSHSGRTMRIWNTSTQNAVFEEHYSGSNKRDVMQINRVSGQDRLAGWSKEGPAIFWDGRPTQANAN